MGREQGVHGAPPFRFECRQQPERRLVAVGALRADVEGAQRHHSAFLVFDPDGVFCGRREDVDPTVPQGELAGVRHDLDAAVAHLDEQLRQKLGFDFAPRMHFDRTVVQRCGVESR